MPVASQAFGDAMPIRSEDVFRSENPSVSVSFSQHDADVEHNQEMTAEFWASRHGSGLSFRVSYHLENLVTQMVIFYPDADPFMLRFTLVPSKKLCYKNQFVKKTTAFDPHMIPFTGLWHSLLDGLSRLSNPDMIVTLEGEEQIAGLTCKKVMIGDTSKDGNLVWYSPKVDLILKRETYKSGKLIAHSEVTSLKEGEIPSSTFVLPKDCHVDDLTSKEFDSLDVRKLSKK